MPWGVFAAALLITYLLQTSVVGYFLTGSGTTPALDLFLVLALLCGFLTPVHDARIGAWLIGFANDLASSDTLGLHAFALGVVAIVLTNLRDTLNARVWWVRLLASFLAGLSGQIIIFLHMHFWPGGGELGSFSHLAWSAIMTALVAAALATAVTQLPWLLSPRIQRRRFPPVRW